ncbi:hypothetical protein FRC10_005291 [Ceratobasidium sp. 414]|nr:hypothetical protein FRC10_005291 [Ceratobasidium sp. 414]
MGVVAGRHLPPLPLHDFEDYLRYVEGTSRGLHALLLLLPLPARFTLSDTSTSGSTATAPSINTGFNRPSTSMGGYRPRDLWEHLSPCQDRTLKEDFAYAKAEWLDRCAPARLDLSEEMRRVGFIELAAAGDRFEWCVCLCRLIWGRS